jgi:hypothetical protein
MAMESAKWIKTGEEKLFWSKSLNSKQNKVANLHTGPMLR